MKNIITKYWWTYVLVAFIFFFAGMYVHRRYISGPFSFLGAMSSVAMKEGYSETQYKNANYKDGKDALLEYINLLDDLKAHGYNNGKYMSEKSYYYNTGFAYAHLALLEEKNGNVQDKGKYFSEAINRFKLAGWQDYSEEHIRIIVRNRDKFFNK